MNKIISNKIAARFIGCLFLLNFAHSEIALSLPVRYGSQVQNISIVYGKPALFRFDEPVKTLSNASKFEILPADETSPDYSVLKVRARYRRSKGEISFVLANGAVVRVMVKTVSKHIPEKTHDFYDFLPQKEEIQRELEEDSSISQMGLLKAMIRGDKVAGYSSRKVNRTALSGDPNLKVDLLRLYTGAKYNGYIFKVSNKSRLKKYQIKLEKLSIGHPNTALLSQIDNKVLEQKGKSKSSTILRVVASATATYYNINLPFKEFTPKRK